uniref:Trehalase n=1 Tax=Anisakis simplex TaxID=6269 RepID=A0A0M3K2I0_ANISI
LLHAVMMLHLYTDSKAFVDKPLKTSAKSIMAEFTRRFPGKITYGDREKVREFVHEFFHPISQEMSHCDLPDWQENPPKLSHIRDPRLNEFALTLNKIWSKLCRQMPKEVVSGANTHSLIYVPNHFWLLVRLSESFAFRQSFSYSGLHETTKAMLENFQHMIEKFGFIPNGGRLYYLRRSQPPFFIPMVNEYYAETKDEDTVAELFAAMETEFGYWTKRRRVKVTINKKDYNMFQYRAESNVPRNRDSAFLVHSSLGKNVCSTMSEIGYFAKLPSVQKFLGSRSNPTLVDSPFIHFENQFGHLLGYIVDNYIRCACTVFDCPPKSDSKPHPNLRPESYREDYLIAEKLRNDSKHKLWRNIASAAESGECEKAKKYKQMYRKFMKDFWEVFYDKKEGAWYDYNIRGGYLNDAAYPTMIVPLFTQCYDEKNNSRMLLDVHETLRRRGLLNFVAGVPTSLKKGTDQQWDYPNGWAPLNHMVIEGLRKSGEPELQKTALELATKWVSKNYAVYKKQGTMWEKYDVTMNRPARGGEYENQEGFGWTNGVILDLLTTYANVMKLNESALLDNNNGTEESDYEAEWDDFLKRYNLTRSTSKASSSICIYIFTTLFLHTVVYSHYQLS